MRLKHYQEKVLITLKNYLGALNDFKVKYRKALEFDADMARDYDFSETGISTGDQLNNLSFKKQMDFTSETSTKNP